MCSYNAVNGKPSCANPELLQDLLRAQWGFDGFVVSDCGAVNGILWPHQFVKCDSMQLLAEVLLCGLPTT